jgi:chondroitin 4-sulfotransferase 11
LIKNFKIFAKTIFPPFLLEFFTAFITLHRAKKAYLQERNLPTGRVSLNAFYYYKCIFVHIPKSAGISVSYSLFGPINLAHLTIQQYEEKIPSLLFKKYFKFCFVRNPFDRLASAYFFIKKGGVNKTDEAFSKETISQYTDFEDFVIRGLETPEVINWIHFRPQVYFIKDSSGKINLDFVGKVENLESDFNYILEKIGLKRNLEHLNKTGNHKDYKSLYTQEMKAKVESLYKEDFELLGYNSFLE